jgi:tetratricopeptide (TPR) repeat protein
VKSHLLLRVAFLGMALLTAGFVAVAEEHSAPVGEGLTWLSPQQDDAVTHYNLGITLGAKGDFDGAIAELRMAIDERPNFPRAHYALGRALGAKHDMDGAIAEFRTAIAQQANYPEAHYYLGNALGVKGDFDGAITEFRTALAQRPDYPEAQVGLNRALGVKGVLVPAQEPTSVPTLSITFANEPWILAFDAMDFAVQRNELQPDGRAYLLAENQKTTVALSVYLARVSGSATEADCDKTQKQRLEGKAEFKREAVATTKSAGMTIVEYTIPEFQGVPIQQRNLFACLPKGDVYVDIHISKAAFTPQDEKLFSDILGSAHFIQKTSPDTK